MADPLVQPMAGPAQAQPVVAPPAPETQTPAPPMQEQQQPVPDEANIPEPPEALIKIPAFQALFAGSPPAVSYQIHGQDDREERKIAEENAEYLKQAGFATYRALDKEHAVIYNALRINGDDLAAADKMGKLSQVAPDFDAVNHAVSKSGLSHPIFHAGEVPNATPAARSASIAPQSATADALAARINGQQAQLTSGTSIVPPASSSAQRKVASARVSALKPTAPTSGSAPGQGALLNSILKPVV